MCVHTHVCVYISLASDDNDVMHIFSLLKSQTKGNQRRNKNKHRHKKQKRNENELSANKMILFCCLPVCQPVCMCVRAWAGMCELVGFLICQPLVARLAPKWLKAIFKLFSQSQRNRFANIHNRPLEIHNKCHAHLGLGIFFWQTCPAFDVLAFPLRFLATIMSSA